MEDTYKRFSDVMILDSTLNTNQFNMPLVNFVVIDNYGKSRIVCIALLSNERQGSYEWLFDSFLKKMLVAPDLIYIDEDLSIVNGYFFYQNLLKF